MNVGWVWGGAAALFVTIMAPNMAAEAGENLFERGEGTPGWVTAGWSGPADGMRRLSQRGVTFESLLVTDLSKSMGAADSQDWFNRYSWDLTAEIEGAKAAGWKGGSAALHMKQHRETWGTPWDGMVQLSSNIDAESRTSLYEAWGQQQLWGERLRVKVGRIDANTEFDAVPTALDFLNVSMGFSPTLLQFPAYPDPRMGGVVTGRPAPRWQVSAGRFATNAGTISLAEATHVWAAEASEAGGRAVAGMWKLNGTLDRFDGSAASGTRGYYGVLEQPLWRSGESGGRRLAGFLQAGTGDARLNPVSLHLGGGTVLERPLGKRPHDALGVAATLARLSREPAAGFTAGGEVVVEGYYKARLGRGLALISDVQYYHHPGGVLSHGDTVMATPRLVVSF